MINIVHITNVLKHLIMKILVKESKKNGSQYLIYLYVDGKAISCDIANNDYEKLEVIKKLITKHGINKDAIEEMQYNKYITQK